MSVLEISNINYFSLYQTTDHEQKT